MTDDSLVDRLRAAAATIKEAELAPDLRPAGFVLAYHATIPAQDTARGRGIRKGPSAAREDDVRGLLDSLQGIDREQLDLVYDLQDDQVSLIVPTRVLSASRRSAMAEVTLLTVAARQGLGFDEWTPADTIRRECEERGVLDRNFAVVLDGLNGQGLRVRGRGRSREVRMNAAGYEETVRIVERLTSALA